MWVSLSNYKTFSTCWYHDLMMEFVLITSLLRDNANHAKRGALGHLHAELFPKKWNCMVVLSYHILKYFWSCTVFCDFLVSHFLQECLCFVSAVCLLCYMAHHCVVCALGEANSPWYVRTPSCSEVDWGRGCSAVACNFLSGTNLASIQLNLLHFEQGVGGFEAPQWNNSNHTFICCQDEMNSQRAALTRLMIMMS